MNLRDELSAALEGINCVETIGNRGWWTTSTGANFGAEKLAKVLAIADKHQGMKSEDKMSPCRNTQCPRNDQSESGCMDHSIFGADVLCSTYRNDEP